MGSSAGSASAVASNIAAVAITEDTGKAKIFDIRLLSSFLHVS